MKKISLVIYICLLILGGAIMMTEKKHKLEEVIIPEDEKNANVVEPLEVEEEIVVEEEVIIEEDPIVYDNMTLDELADKLNRSLNSTISGKGDIIASYSLEKGVDPYLAVAIILHETGCKWECSYLVRACNNVGGQKGSPGCNGGAYKAFNSLDEGIRGYIDNLANNYYAYGLTTAEAMQSKYAGSTTWAAKVNNYIESIKAN